MDRVVLRLQLLGRLTLHHFNMMVHVLLLVFEAVQVFLDTFDSN